MAISSKDIISLTHARAKLTELCEEVNAKGSEKIITKNGKSCAALIDAERLDLLPSRGARTRSLELAA